MSENIVSSRPEAGFIPVEQEKDYRFFDPKTPETPQEVFGTNTASILRLGKIAARSGVLPPRVDLGLYALPEVVRLMPLLEKVQSGEELAPEDVRPYRKTIKKLHPGLNAADKLAASASVVGVGIPLRRALNRRVEQEFPAYAAEKLREARESVAGIEDEVKFISQFENPREQFDSEIKELAAAATIKIEKQHTHRLENNLSPESEYEPPKGFFGFVTKVVRKVRSFFGRIFGKPKINNEVTAHDAGIGLENTLESFRTNSQQTKERLPILSRFVFSKLPKNLPITKDRLALVAPEIVEFLYSTSAKNKSTQRLIDNISRNSHELRFLAERKKYQSRRIVESLQYASIDLLPAIRDMLPTNGEEVLQTYNEVRLFLEANPFSYAIRQEKDAKEKSGKGIKAKFRKLFRRSLAKR